MTAGRRQDAAARLFFLAARRGAARRGGPQALACRAAHDSRPTTGRQAALAGAAAVEASVRDQDARGIGKPSGSEPAVAADGEPLRTVRPVDGPWYAHSADIKADGAAGRPGPGRAGGAAGAGINLGVF